MEEKKTLRNVLRVIRRGNIRRDGRLRIRIREHQTREQVLRRPGIKKTRALRNADLRNADQRPEKLRTEIHSEKGKQAVR